jgi:hypothetical protein
MFRIITDFFRKLFSKTDLGSDGVVIEVDDDTEIGVMRGKTWKDWFIGFTKRF